MSAAAKLARKLLDDAAAQLDVAEDAAAWLRAARKAVLDAAEDVTVACQATLGAILAAEAAKDAADCAAKALRRLLTEALEAGPGIVRTDSHTASTGQARRKVIITGIVPPEWMIVPEPKPDTERIAKALARKPLPFATLSNGGGPVLSIRSRDKI